MANEKKFIATVEADAEAVIEKITAVVKRGVFWWHKKPYTTGTVLSGLPKQEVQHLVDAGHLAVVDPAAAPAQVVVSAAPAAPAAR